APRRGSRNRDHAAYRSPARPVFLGHEACLAARDARAPRARSPWRARVRHDRELADLEAHAWRAPSDGPDECEPNDAARHSHETVGRRVARAAPHPACGVAAHRTLD